RRCGRATAVRGWRDAARREQASFTQRGQRSARRGAETLAPWAFFGRAGGCRRGGGGARRRGRRRCTSRWSPVLRVEVRKILTRYMLWGYPYCKSSAQRRTRAQPKGDVHGSSEEGSSEEGGEEARQEEGSGQEGDGEEGRQG